MPRPAANARVVTLLSAVRRRWMGMAACGLVVAAATVLAVAAAPRTYRLEGKMLCHRLTSSAPTNLASFLRTQQEILLSDTVLVPAIMALQEADDDRQLAKITQPEFPAAQVTQFARSNAALVEHFRRGVKVEYPDGLAGAADTFGIVVDFREPRTGLFACESSAEACRDKETRFFLALINSYRLVRGQLQAQRQELALRQLDESMADIAREAFSRASTAVEEFLVQSQRKEAMRLLEPVGASNGFFLPGAQAVSQTVVDLDRVGWLAQYQHLVQQAETARAVYDQAVQNDSLQRRRIVQDQVLVTLLDGPRFANGGRAVRPTAVAAMWGAPASLVAALAYLAVATWLAGLRGRE